MHRRGTSATVSVLFAMLLLATLFLAGSAQSAGGYPGASTDHAAGPSVNPLRRSQSADHPSANPLPESAASLTGAIPQQQAENVEFVGQIGGTTYAVAVQGNYAYIGVGPRLVILNVSDPAHPWAVRRTAPLPDIVRGVALAGSFAYLVDGDAGLRISDVSNPAAPFEVGFFDTPGVAYGIALAGSLAFVADGNAGLRIIDVSNPAASFEVGFFDTPGGARGIALAGSLAFVTDGSAGLRIIDVSNPATPAEVGAFGTPA